MFVVFACVLILFPIIIIFLAQKISILDKIGLIVLAFSAGLLFSITYQPTNAIIADQLALAKSEVSEVTIALAIPLLLFSINIPSSLKFAKKTIKGMLLACLSMCLSGLLTAYFFADKISSLWQVAGMTVGAYTGGGQNIGAIKAAINADDELFIDILTYDIVISAVYILVATTVLKPIASLYLRRSPTDTNTTKFRAELDSDKGLSSKSIKGKFDHIEDFGHMSDDSAQGFNKLIKPKNFKEVIAVIGLALFCVATSLGMAQLFQGSMHSVVIILCLTTLATLLSFIPNVRHLKCSYQQGMFFLLVFCFISGSMADVGLVTELKIEIFIYMAISVVCSILLHGLLCKLFKLDVDTFVVTSTAAVMSVPFIPMITSSIKNKTLLFPGIAAGMVGYLLGNYLGVILAYLVRWQTTFL